MSSGALTPRILLSNILDVVGEVRVRFHQFLVRYAKFAPETLPHHLRQFGILHHVFPLGGVRIHPENAGARRRARAYGGQSGGHQVEATAVVHLILALRSALVHIEDRSTGPTAQWPAPGPKEGNYPIVIQSRL